MANQGNALSAKEIHKIIQLLAKTELTIRDIAERMSCSRSAIASINRRYGVRVYSGMRSVWRVRLPEVEYDRQRM